MPDVSQLGPDEARTIRELRLVIRRVEQAAERAHMAPAASLGVTVEWYLRKARLALRQAEIAAARSDDPRLEPLEPLRPQLRKPRPSTAPKRRRYRCPVCFSEHMMRAVDVTVESGRHRYAGVLCSGSFEPIARLPKGIHDA